MKKTPSALTFILTGIFCILVGSVWSILANQSIQMIGKGAVIAEGEFVPGGQITFVINTNKFTPDGTQIYAGDVQIESYVLIANTQQKIELTPISVLVGNEWESSYNGYRAINKSPQPVAVKDSKLVLNIPNKPEFGGADLLIRVTAFVNLPIYRERVETNGLFDSSTSLQYEKLELNFDETIQMRLGENRDWSSQLSLWLVQNSIVPVIFIIIGLFIFGAGITVATQPSNKPTPYDRSGT
jgi:hypothetical protein